MCTNRSGRLVDCDILELAKMNCCLDIQVDAKLLKELTCKRAERFFVRPSLAAWLNKGGGGSFADKQHLAL